MPCYSTLLLRCYDAMRYYDTMMICHYGERPLTRAIMTRIIASFDPDGKS